MTVFWFFNNPEVALGFGRCKNWKKEIQFKMMKNIKFKE